MGAECAGSGDLIRLVYEGVFRREAWRELLALACHLFRAKDAYLGRMLVTPPGPPLVLTHGVDPDVAAAYRETWAAPPRNPVLTRLSEAGHHGLVEPRQVVPMSRLERTEFYDICRRPRGVDAEIGCGDIEKEKDFWFFSVNRATGDPPFGEAERTLISLLYPHVIQALRHDRILSAERDAAAWARRAVDDLDDAVIRRDPDGRLRPLNEAGEGFLRAEGLGVWDGDSLLPRDPRPSSRPEGPTRAAGAAGVERSFRSGRAFRVFSSPCFEGDRFAGEVVRLRLGARSLVAAPFSGEGAFTERESEVASLMCEGLSSAGIRFRLGISANTLNTHVRHLFEKTGCHSRAQLVARLAPVLEGTDRGGRRVSGA